MKKIMYFVIIVIVALFTAGCNKGNVMPLKTSTLKLNFSTVKNNPLSNAKTANLGFVLNSLKVSINNIVIEENSGNDVQQQGNHNDGVIDGIESNTNKDAGSDAADITVAGPFVLNVINGIASIDEIDIYPGTFKKVDFTFLPNNNAEFGGNSLFLKGNYSASDGSNIPVTLRSEFNQGVQIPLANGGLSVTANSKVTLSVILDVQNWMDNLNLSTVNVSNGEILIDKSNNPALLAHFNDFLATKIEAEN